MPSRRQNSSSEGKKHSPGSNRTPKVRPVVSSWLCIRLIIPSASGDRPGLVIVQAAGAERGGDLVAAGAAGKQDVQQQPGLEGIQEARADQAPAEQVVFGARKAVGGGEDRSGARAGREGNRDLAHERVEDGHGG